MSEIIISKEYRCDCCIPSREYKSRQALYRHVNRDRINFNNFSKKRSINNLDTSVINTTQSIHTTSTLDNISSSVNGLIQSTNLLVELDVKPEVIFKKLKTLVTSNRDANVKEIRDRFREMKKDLGRSEY